MGLVQVRVDGYALGQAFESTAGYLILILTHARHTGDCFHVPFVVGVLMIRCNTQIIISAERDLVFPIHARHIGVCFRLPFVVVVLMMICCNAGRVIYGKRDQFPKKLFFQNVFLKWT